MQVSRAHLIAEEGGPLQVTELESRLAPRTDYKVIAKAILLRLGSVLVDVVYPDQTDTVPGHTIFDNLCLVWDLLKLGCRMVCRSPSCPWIRRRHSTVDHGYFLGTLRAFDFRPQYVSFLQVLYAPQSVWSG
ncbi:unnamed protein product [Caretta caretta]